MRILVLSDIHGRLENLEKAIKLIHNKGVCHALILGDLTNFGGKREAEQVLAAFKGFDAMAIPGNLDTREVLAALEEQGVSLHGKRKKLGKWIFAGFGGGLLGGPGEFMFSEEEIGKALHKLAQGGKKEILATHLPPFGTKIDMAGAGVHIGSRTVKHIIEEKQPALHLCGHAHESFGEEKIGKTISVNAGALKDGRALLLNLGDEMKWERIQL